MRSRFFLGATVATLFTSPALALDVERFESLVDRTIAVIDSGKIAVDELFQYQDALIDIGISGARSFAEEHPEHAAAMNFVAARAESMKALNLVEIETEWHEGEALEATDIDLDALYDDDDATAHIEAVIHPATAYIAVRAYEVTGDDDYLDQVRDELEEIVDHFDDID